MGNKVAMKAKQADPMGIRDIALIGAATTLVTAFLATLSAGLGTAGAEHGEPMPAALAIHLATVLPALPLGAYLLLRRKGGRLHRLLGRIWAALMMTTAVASFWLTGEAGGLSFIHIFSVVTVIGVPVAVLAIRKGDVERHRWAMTSTFIGLVVAGAFAFTPGRLLGNLLFG